MQDLFGNLVNDNQIEFPTDYNSIIERIHHINPVRYASTRNFINGGVTYLSPYISRGIISIKQIKDVIIKKGYKPYEIDKLLQELAWREYYQRVWQNKNELIWEDLKQTQPDVLHHEMIQSIVNANTGIQIIDDQINQFYATGYLHNHIRMYLGTIVCNVGKAHWLTPSKWLYYHLLDGDIASNNCSWQWVAGAFASKKYYCNQENINKYTFTNQLNTFMDKSYEIIASMPVPETLKETNTLNLASRLPQTLLPVIDITKPTLIYNSYNIDPNWRSEEDVNRVLLLEPSHFNKYPVSDKVINFIINLSKNIKGIQVYCGALEDIEILYKDGTLNLDEAILSKEHPAFNYYTGKKDNRDWMFPEVSGYYPSFFSYWKKCQKWL